MPRIHFSLAVILGTCVLAAACGDSTPTTPTNTETPTEFTETFAGTLTINGAATHPFVVQRAGTASATLTTLSPDNTAVISLSLGTWNGLFCQIILANDAATPGTTGSVTGTASVGNFCVRVSDVGKLTAPTDYEISVRHF